jgi:hypothetical protein
MYIFSYESINKIPNKTNRSMLVNYGFQEIYPDENDISSFLIKDDIIAVGKTSIGYIDYEKYKVVKILKDKLIVQPFCSYTYKLKKRNKCDNIIFISHIYSIFRENYNIIINEYNDLIIKRIFQNIDLKNNIAIYLGN